MRKKLQGPGTLGKMIEPLVQGSLLPETRDLTAPHAASGQLEAIDGETLRVRIGDRSRAIACDTATRFLDHGIPVGIASLRRGDRLELEWHHRGDRDVALRVEIVEAGAAPH